MIISLFRRFPVSLRKREKGFLFFDITVLVFP